MHRNKVIKNYFGSKNTNGLYQFIINHFKQHKTYIEGFLGSGIILQMKKAVEKNIAFEIDAAVIDKWNDYCQKENLTLINKSFIDNFTDECSTLDLNETLVYLDPPYITETRSSSHRYKHEFTLQDHIDLLTMVLKVKTNYVISCYDNNLYSSMLPGWNKASCNSITRAGIRVETIYFNYELNASNIAEFTYYGRNFTDRQRIKRKVTRTINKLKNLPPIEREALLSEIKKEFMLINQ